MIIMDMGVFITSSPQAYTCSKFLFLSKAKVRCENCAAVIGASLGI